MRYVIERDSDGRWVVTAYNEAGQVGAKVLCSSATKAMQVFLMLEGHTRLEDERTEDLDEVTQKIEAA